MQKEITSKCSNNAQAKILFCVHCLISFKKKTFVIKTLPEAIKTKRLCVPVQRQRGISMIIKLRSPTTCCGDNKKCFHILYFKNDNSAL